MDPSRIESYLRSTCSVLDFDIGELWCARKLPGQRPQLKFIQLYTSPTYEDFHSLLVQPDQSNEMGNHDEEKHRFSPVICRGVCEGGQIVWANTRISEGLTGRIDLPLNTAVGVPICSIGNDLYILVLFAVGLISMAPASVEYLVTVARAVAEGSNGFLSASFFSTVSPANTENFVGVWDISELVRKYSNEVEFHLLPMGRLQKFFDCHEILLFCDLFMDFKMSRDGRFTAKQLESLRDSYKGRRDRSDSVSSLGSHTWDISPEEDLTIASTEAIAGGSDLPDHPELASLGDNSSNHGVFSADLNSLEQGLEPVNNNKFVKLDSLDISNHLDSNKSTLHIYAHMTYKLSQCRFHEFMIAMLGMTVFESAELWLLQSELSLVAAVYRSGPMQKWISLSETIRLRVGMDVPGRVLESGRSHWDAEYGKHITPMDPRAKAAQEIGVHTAFGVPLPGLRGICGTIVFYSSKDNFQPEPLLVLLIEKAVQLMAASALDSSSWARWDGDESILSQQSQSFSKWLTDEVAQPAASMSPPPARGSPPIPRASKDFEQRLQMCRSLVNKPSEDRAMEVAPLYPHTYTTSTPVPVLATLNTINKQAFTEPDPAQTASQIQEDSVAHAAFALANFGRVEWHSFLEGSGKDIKLGPEPHVPVKPAPLDGSLPCCKVEGCTALVESNVVQYCIQHRTNRRCQKEGCDKCAQGATKFCIAHGGGRRCTFAGCNKGARDKFFCAAHGGGKRCTSNGCTKSAVGGSSFCTAHGGGKRCQVPDCPKSSQSNTLFCVKHGGGRLCKFEGCTKVARGKTDHCAMHGGGVRCRTANCNKLAMAGQQVCKIHSDGTGGEEEEEEDEEFQGVAMIASSLLGKNAADRLSSEQQPATKKMKK